MGKPTLMERVNALKEAYMAKGYSESDWEAMLTGGLSEEDIMWVKASSPGAAVGNQVAWAIEEERFVEYQC